MNHTHRIQTHYEAQEGKSIIEIIKDKLLLDFLGRRRAKKRRKGAVKLVKVTVTEFFTEVA